MKRYLIYADAHWSQYSSIIRRRGAKYSVRLHGLIDTFNWLASTARQYNVDEIISCGDTFDTPSLNAEELTALQDVDWTDIPKTFLVGNHESNINTLEFSSTKVFESLGARIVSTPITVNVSDSVNFYFIPYITSDKVVKLKDVIGIDKNKKAVVFAHSDIAGLQYGKFISQSGFDINDILSNCNLFIDGHLHNGMILENKVVLVGNITGQNFNENSTQYEHLAYLLTVEDDGVLKLEQIENPYAFNFYKIKIESESDIEQLYHLKNNSVLSLMCVDNLVKKVESIISSIPNIIEHRTIITYSIEKASGDSKIFNVEDHLTQFIEFVQTKIEPSPALNDELARLGGSVAN